MLCLIPELALHPDATKRFLIAALALDAPTPERLATSGVPHYEALPLCRRLESAGELVAGAWVSEARAGYRALLASEQRHAAGNGAGAETETDDQTPRSQRRLERMTPADRPREKALRSGIASLSDTELLALLLRTGTGDEGVLEMADRLLLDHDGLVGLARSDLDALCRSRGIGPAKATEIAAVFELGSRLAQSTRRRERVVLDSPEAIAAFVAIDLVRRDHECFWCLPLDARLCLIGEPRQITQGDVDGTEAPPRAFFRHALLANATSCLAIHNHPTGDPTPSAADRAVTMHLIAAGRHLGVPLNDHLVIGDGGRFSSLRRLHPECWR